jgi:hypothetical protein
MPDRQWFWPHALDHGSDKCTRRKVLTRTGLGVLGVLFKQSFIDITFHVGIEDRPHLVVDHVDKPVELCGILDFILCFEEYLADHAFIRAEFVEDIDILRLKLRPAFGEQTFPAQLFRDIDFSVIWRFCILVRHFEKEQIRELFDIVTVAHPVVAERVTVIPDALYD